MTHNQDYKCSTFKGPMWALHSSLLAERFFLASLLACTKSFTSLVFCVVGDTLGDFIRRSAKIARRARCSDCDRRPANKFAKCARSRNFYNHSCESPVKPTHLVGRFYYMTFQNCHIAAIGEKFAKCARINRWQNRSRFSLAIKFAAISV